MRLDAHCSAHAKCKCDRVLKRAPVGLLLLWLATPHASKRAHDKAKYEFSGAPRRADRDARRQAFVDAAGGCALRNAIIDCEAETRGATDKSPTNCLVYGVGKTI